MLRLFFVITTLTTLVKSENVIEWLCEDINQLGNCSSLPNIPMLLRMMENDSNTNKYSDIYYCPYNIVQRNARCIHSYYRSCYEHMTNEDKIFFTMNLPNLNEPSFCTSDRPYKKEFREHMACVKELAKSNDKLEVPYKQWQQYLEQQKLEYERKEQELQLKSDQKKFIADLQFWREHEINKCQYVKEFMLLRYTQMRSRCGLKTEKFFRQLLNNIWPMSAIAKNCESDLFLFYET